MVELRTLHNNWVPDIKMEKFIKETLALYYTEINLDIMPNLSIIAWDHSMTNEIYEYHFDEDYEWSDEEYDDIKQEYYKSTLTATEEVMKFYHLTYEVNPLNRAFGFQYYAKEVW